MLVKETTRRGFTLVELLVVIAIMGVLSATLVVAYPRARSEQKLTLAQQTLQAALRTAQQATINEQRDDKCIQAAAALGTDQKRCSDTGIILIPAENNMIVFADISKIADNTFDSDDYPIATIPFPDGVRVEPATPPTTLIFEGAPPVIKLFKSSATCGTPPCEITDSIMITLSIGEATRELDIGSYGQVERR